MRKLHCRTVVVRALVFLVACTASAVAQDLRDKSFEVSVRLDHRYHTLEPSKAPWDATTESTLTFDAVAGRFIVSSNSTFSCNRGGESTSIMMELPIGRATSEVIRCPRLRTGTASCWEESEVNGRYTAKASKVGDIYTLTGRITLQQKLRARTLDKISESSSDFTYSLAIKFQTDGSTCRVIELLGEAEEMDSDVDKPLDGGPAERSKRRYAQRQTLATSAICKVVQRSRQRGPSQPLVPFEKCN